MWRRDGGLVKDRDNYFRHVGKERDEDLGKLHSLRIIRKNDLSIARSIAAEIEFFDREKEVQERQYIVVYGDPKELANWCKPG